MRLDVVALIGEHGPETGHDREGGREQAINALRGHLAEFGVIAAKGPVHTSKLMAALEDPASDLPQAARAILAVLVAELRSLDERVAVLDREIAQHVTGNPVAADAGAGGFGQHDGPHRLGAAGAQ